MLDGVRRILLVRSDDSRRPALDPTCAVHTGHRHPAGSEHATAVVRDRACALVVWNVRQRDASIADAAEHDPARDQLAFVRRNRANASTPVGLEPVERDLDRLDALVAADRDRRETEPEPDGLRLAGPLPPSESAEDLDVPPHHVRGGLEFRLTGRIDAELPRIDEHVRTGEIPELAELGRRPRS